MFFSLMITGLLLYFSNAGATSLSSENVMKYGAKCDGSTIDTKAFNNMAMALGYVVVPPDVTCIVNNWAVPSSTKIVGIDYPNIKSTVPFGSFDINAGIHDVDISGLSFTSGNYKLTNYAGIQIGGPSGAYNISIHENRFTNINNGIWINGGASKPSTAIDVGGNYFEDVGEAIQILGLSQSAIHDNVVHYAKYLYRGIAVLYADNIRIVKNTIIGDTSTTVTGIIFYYNGSTGTYDSHDNLIAGNLIRNIREEGISLDTYNNSGFKYGGTATGGSTTSLVDSRASWTINTFANYYVFIVDGTGKGEYQPIISNTGKTLTVAKSFKVAPDATSKYVVAAAPMRNTIANNSIDTTLREGIYIWESGVDNIIRGNSLINAGKPETRTAAISLSGAKYKANNYRGPVFHNVISNNDVKNNAYIGILSRAYSDGGDPGYSLQSNIIENNTINGGDIGIQLEETQFSQVRSNILSNNNTGVKLLANSNNSHNVIVDNITTGCAVPYDINQAEGYVAFESDAAPLSGTYPIGTFVRNANPSLNKMSGYATTNQQYTVRGWRRITSGSTNKLNTDWVEEKVFTGH